VLCRYTAFSYHCNRLHILQPNSLCLGIIYCYLTQKTEADKSHRCTETRERPQFEDEEINTGRNRLISKPFQWRAGFIIVFYGVVTQNGFVAGGVSR